MKIMNMKQGSHYQIDVRDVSEYKRKVLKLIILNFVSLLNFRHGSESGILKCSLCTRMIVMKVDNAHINLAEMNDLEL